MTRTIVPSRLGVAVCLTVLVSAAGCTREDAEDRAIIEQALATIEYRPESRIRFVMPRLNPGTVIKLADEALSSAKKIYTFVVPESGYLLFIQEYPGCDNANVGNFFFVPAARPASPVLLGHGCNTSEVRDSSGRLIQQTCVVVAWGKPP